MTTYRVMLSGVVLYTTTDRIDAVMLKQEIENEMAVSGLDCWPQIVEYDDEEDKS
jgi:hypothetical protein